MDQTSEVPERPAARAVRPSLALVSPPFGLAPDAPPEWRAALAALTDAFAIEPARLPAGFAPWTSWSPAVFQDGGAPVLPPARFAASHCIDPVPGGADIMLLSPHPAVGEGDADTLRAMLGAAREQGRERTALIVHERQRATLAALRLDEGPAPEILAIEAAIPALLRPRAAWDAVIVMPDLRGIVAALLAEATGLSAPAPMLWHGEGLVAVTCERVGEAASNPLPLDAQALVLALALTLGAVGECAAARRLHEGWALLRARGVTTRGRGSEAPYACEVGEAGFIALLCRETAAISGGHGAQGTWHDRKNQHKWIFRAPTPTLRIVSANLAKS
ncbi:hypothetical protein ACLBKU_15740 [Erythrobacter sp. NE805]|uniref:hypothetical protein n=1 Tax=Erythrobacter sp. NE805 TaxID=3389875 RepID=UPI00396B45AC